MPPPSSLPFNSFLLIDLPCVRTASRRIFIEATHRFGNQNKLINIRTPAIGAIGIPAAARSKRLSMSY